ncbi:hypothetical protein PsorP6_010827 [Peronosclerospora sorghi]|uniref:Uncharacterized protein n=1 Tax=Peronosclerospora sorghi TaxID=230839 RepID=A0ACC0VXI6_9STRA|nr:hypothetical protein PsorP6_010827 [Peronosclerospora sorghi]
MQGMQVMRETAVHWWRHTVLGTEDVLLYCCPGRRWGDGTVLVQVEGAGGEGGVALSLEALVDEEPDLDWPDHSWMPVFLSNPFGHYHEGSPESRWMRSSPSNAMIASGSYVAGFSMSKEAARTSYFSRQSVNLQFTNAGKAPLQHVTVFVREHNAPRRRKHVDCLTHVVAWRDENLLLEESRHCFNFGKAGETLENALLIRHEHGFAPVRKQRPRSVRKLCKRVPIQDAVNRRRHLIVPHASIGNGNPRPLAAMTAGTYLDEHWRAPAKLHLSVRRSIANTQTVCSVDSAHEPRQIS